MKSRQPPPLLVLLAEDDLDDRNFFEKALKEIPVPTRLATVSDGDALMQYLAENQNHPPDLLFLDLSMPRKTGIECLSEIAENPLLKGMRIVMISTLYSRDRHYEDSVIKMLHELGAQDFIRKPGDFKQLKKGIEAAIIQTLEKKKAGGGGAKTLRILLADDDRDDRLFFKMALDSLTIPTQLVAVVDGEKLMDCLAENADQLPDALFLDLNMPRKNGFECLSEIKSNPLLKSLPVIIFSTSFEQEVVNLLFKNGAQFFMRKPAEFSRLKKIIQQTVQRITGEAIGQPGREDFVLTVGID